MESDPLLSQTLGNYQIQGRLGRGGMSTVYRARQITMQRDVAMKVMSAELAEDPQFIARFEREAQVIANLEHPRILPVHDYGHQGEYVYMVMRLIEGESLHDRLLHGPLALPAAADLLDQIASALDYAHSRGVIHRDLKPNNILLDQFDNIYLMDFGIAKLMAAAQQLTATGMVMGTPAYMAPEQWRGEQVDARTDEYALGVILYEMVVGCQPFEASDTPFTLMYKHLNDAPPPPRDRIPDLPAEVERVILKALAKDLSERYQSAGDLAEDFRAAIQEAATDTGDAPAAVPPEASTMLEPAPQPETPAIPLPSRIAPPPVPPTAPRKPGIPVPPRPAPLPGAEDRPAEPAVAGKRRTGDSTPLPFELPDEVPPAARKAIAWAAEAVQHVNIPGFIAPEEDQSAPPPPLPVDYGEWEIPQDAPAPGHVGTLLEDGEPLVGVLYVRGTASWRLWRRLFFAGLVLAIFGGICSGLFNLWLFNLIGTLCWLYLVIQGIRIWRGKIGHYYVGFTPESVIILPLSGDGKPQTRDAESAVWSAIHRLHMTTEYLWLEASGSDPVGLLAWIPAHGWGGLERQRKGLLTSPLARLLRDKGFAIKS
jgi:serine/threonine protein kinase